MSECDVASVSVGTIHVTNSHRELDEKARAKPGARAQS